MGVEVVVEIVVNKVKSAPTLRTYNRPKKGSPEAGVFEGIAT